jgi:hypothetical protein
VKKLILLAIACIALAAGIRAQDHPANGDAPLRFTHLDIFIDSGAVPLAVWQFELSAPGAAKIVGVESGGVKGFQNPPYHDPAALQNSRIIVGAFNNSPDLPSGRTHVARLHFAIEDGVVPQYALQLVAAGNASGERIPATISFAEGATR